MDPLVLLKKCNDQALKFLELINPDQWTSQTETEWNAKELLNHSLALNYLAQELLNGSGPELFAKFEYNFVAEQPILDAWKNGTSLALSALSAPNALEKIVLMPFGEISGSALTNILATENLFYAWDLAQATGQDDTIDPLLVDYFYSFYESQRRLLKAVDAGREVLEVEESSDLQTKLLALLGRRRH